MYIFIEKMSLVQNLPVDNNPVTKQESELIKILFEKPSNDDTKKNTPSEEYKLRLLHIFQEGLLIILLFLFFTLPFIDKICEKYLTFLNNTTIYIIRIIIILISFWLIKTLFIQ
jgi:hypothetical protein